MVLSKKPKLLSPGVKVPATVSLEEIAVSQCPTGPDSHWLCSNDVYRISTTCNAIALNFKAFPLAETRHFLWSCRVLISVSLVVFLYPMCLTDLKGANHTGAITVPLWRRPAAILPTFMLSSSTYFRLAVTQTHSFGAGLIGKQNFVMFTA